MRATPLVLDLARRYLRSARRDSFTRFLSATAAGGMAVGVAALVLALAALTGFQQALKAEILARTPEIEVRLAAGADVDSARRRLAAIAGVDRVQLTVSGQGWLITGGRVRPLELVGYEGAPPSIFPALASAAPGLYLSDYTAGLLALEPGAVVEIASSRPTLTPLGPRPRVRRLAVAGTFASGRTEQVERAAVPLAAAEALLGSARRRLLVSTGSLERAVAIAPRVREALPPGSTVRTWRDLNRALLFALRLEKTLMFVAVLLIVVVAALALVASLSLLVAAKQREIGMLGAMGAPRGLLVRSFVLLGALLATAGALVGGAGGVAAAWTLERYRLVRLPAAIYFLDYVPFEVRVGDLAVIVGVALAVAVAASAWGARGAAALMPTEALRR